MRFIDRYAPSVFEDGVDLAVRVCSFAFFGFCYRDFYSRLSCSRATDVRC